jgi:hypothetical protein
MRKIVIGDGGADIFRNSVDFPLKTDPHFFGCQGISPDRSCSSNKTDGAKPKARDDHRPVRPLWLIVAGGVGMRVAISALDRR